MKKLKPLFIIVVIFCIGFGAFCFLYPVVSNLINEHYNESKINEYNKNADTLSKEQVQNYFREAERYNKALAEDISEKNDTGVLGEYFDILDINNGIMGYLEIPSIDVKLPIYHSESSEVLKKGAGHLEHTSFPIGGESTHACISAHCGYPTQKFFDDLDELEKGNDIYICVLNRTMKYTVTDTEVVEPDDSDSLKVIDGEDMVTLITCTPYGINSHRLLVHAKRTMFGTSTSDSVATISEIPHSVHRDNKAEIILAGVAIIAFACVKLYFWRKKRKRFQKSGEGVMRSDCIKSNNKLSNQRRE